MTVYIFSMKLYIYLIKLYNYINKTAYIQTKLYIFTKHNFICSFTENNCMYMQNKTYEQDRDNRITIQNRSVLVFISKCEVLFKLLLILL